MCARFKWALGGPDRWDKMTAAEWDGVPQPIRGIAILRMIEHWQRRYQVGERFGLPQLTVRRRMQAIAMAESWFEHRAANRNRDGSLDLGIGQASAAARSRLRVLYVRGDADFGLAEGDYFDPWKASRALVFWFSLLLNEARGDLDMATRAYNVGSEAARAGGGKPYLQAVMRREANYLRGGAVRPTWTWLRKNAPPAPPEAVPPPTTLLVSDAQP